MQVYLAVQDAQGNTIVVKKSEFNSWWQGRDAGIATLVNQAGQWALPGGKQDSGETETDAAIREFLEETGVNILNYNLGQFQTVPFQYFTLVKVAAAFPLQSIVNAINQNLMPRAQNPARPDSALVKDWELQSAKCVAANDLENHLGNPQSVSQRAAYAKLNAKPYSQSIDWYAQMVPHL